MADLKREYIVPLRRKVKTAPMWRRSKKAISVLKDFMIQHMKAENVVICSELNELVWARGGKNPPGKVAVVALRTTINGVDSTLVNLQEVGIENQLAKYATSVPVAEKETKAKSTKKVEEKSEVKDAEVKEVKEVKVKAVSEEKVEEKKSEAKSTKKVTKKTETKKDTSNQEIAGQSEKKSERTKEE